MTARRFVADTMLGALARWLRAMGYDTAYPGRADDGWLFELARAEHRILITRDVRLAGRAGDRACLIRSRDVDGQIVEAVQALGLVPSREDWLSRCLACNTPLEERPKETVRERVPARVYAAQTEFTACARCDRVYWRGSHTDRIVARLDGLLRPR